MPRREKLKRGHERRTWVGSGGVRATGPAEGPSASPSIVRLAIVNVGRDWRVVTPTARIGPFRRRDQAIAFAINVALDLLHRGELAELHAQSAEGDFELRPLIDAHGLPI